MRSRLWCASVKVGSSGRSLIGSAASANLTYPPLAYLGAESGAVIRRAYPFRENGAPIVAAPTVTGLTATGATLGAEVTDAGSSAITGRGVVYAATATNAYPRPGGPGVTAIAASGTTGTPCGTSLYASGRWVQASGGDAVARERRALVIETVRPDGEGGSTIRPGAGRGRCGGPS